MIFNRRILLVLAVLGLAVALAAGAFAQFKAEYRLSLVVAPDSAWGKGAIRFAELVSEKTDGKVNIRNFFAGALFAGRQTNEFLLLREGVADFAIGSTINWSPQVKELNLFNLPFFISNYDELDAILNGLAGQAINRRLEELGVINLAWGENGFRELSNRSRSVRKPEDLAGLKIRVVGSKIFIDTMNALGGNAISMNWAEAQTAFQQGVVDGQENPVIGIFIPYNLYEVHKYLTVWRYVIDPLVFGVNKGIWDRFPADIKTAIREAAIEAATYERALARVGLDNGWAETHLRAIGETREIPAQLPYDFLRSKGMTVDVLTPAELAAFRVKVEPIIAEWTREIGPELVRMAEADKAAVR